MVLRVRDWDAHYETGASRKLKSMSWLPLPLKRGSGYQRILAQTDGPALFGAWVAIVEFAATCPVRGMLCRRDGREYRASDIAITVGFPVDLITRCFALVTDPDAEIEWLERIDEPEARRILLELSAETADSASETPKTGGSRETTGENGRRREKTSLQDRTKTGKNKTGSDPAGQTNPSSTPSPLKHSAPPPAVNGSPAIKGEEAGGKETSQSEIQWPQVAAALGELGVSRRQQAIANAIQNGFTQPQVLALIDYLKSVPGECKSPAGAICDRLASDAAAEWDANQHWPWSVSREETGADVGPSPYDVPPNVQQLHEQRAERERLERSRQFVADLGRRELAYGDQLNRMEDAAVLALIGEDRVLNRAYLAKGRDSPEVRPMLLKLLELASRDGNGE